MAELAGIPIWIWGAFLAFVLGMLALDLGVFHKEAHEVKIKEALTWSAVWIALALVFNVGIFFLWDNIYPKSEYSSQEAGMAFLAGYLVEKALSVDNIFVFLMVFAYFKVPAQYQHRVLFYGIIGALVFRSLFIAAGAALLENFFWLMIVFGAFLIFTGVKMVIIKDKEVDPEKNPIIRGFRKMMPVTPNFVGQNFFTRIDGRLWATPLFITLLFIELTDIIFAVDSIPAIFAITKDPFIVFTSNVFAILGLRALFFALAGLMKLFHYLSYGLAAILVFVGGKMLYAYMEKVVYPDWPKFNVGLSLGIIITILAVSIVLSIIRPPAKPAHVIPGHDEPEPEADETQAEATVR
ncbi:MAG TPA: TerC family protein [Fimbriimonadaceae bacterium]|nr:TerC family protein [Fimbriimonadaceae bacterium]